MGTAVGLKGSCYGHSEEVTHESYSWLSHVIAESAQHVS